MDQGRCCTRKQLTLTAATPHSFTLPGSSLFLNGSYKHSLLLHHKPSYSCSPIFPMTAFFTRTATVCPTTPRTIEVGCVRMWSSRVQGRISLEVALVGPGIHPCPPSSPAQSNGLLIHRRVLRCFFSLETFCGNIRLFALHYAVAHLSPPPPSPPSHRLGESLRRLLVCMRRFVHWLQLHTKCYSQVHNIFTYTVIRMGVLKSIKNVTLCPGDERDSLFDRHQLHTLQLQYDLKLTAKATVTLAIPSLHGVLYVFKPQLQKYHTRNHDISNKQTRDGIGSDTSRPSLRICGRSATPTDA
jgi:hypothetical protein